jgi:serine/threonine-protein kinase
MSYSYQHQDADVGSTPFGRYRLVELLGRGGMGEVWRTYDTGTDRIVAIKLLPPHFSDNEEFKQRFRREAQAAAKLDTPHVIPIYDYGEIEGRLYVCMRLIEGRDLQSVLADGPLEPPRAVRIIEGVALALHAAHEVGLLHRDIKPSNILLDKNDFAYLIDFGIALAADETRMTKSGYAIGTFAYIAPERLGTRAEEDARADIYSLACVLYECLTGRPPFDAATMAGLVAAHLNTPPPQPSATQPNVPKQIDEVIATGMAKDPDNRYATTVELADAARDAITVPIPRRTPSSPTLPATEQAPLPTTQQAPHRVPAQPMTVKAEPPAPAKPVPPPQLAPPTPARVGRTSRGTTIALIAGAIALVAVIAAAIGIPALVKHGRSASPPTSSSPTSSSPPTSSLPPTLSVRSYGAQVVLPVTDLNAPTDAAIDGTGTLYVADSGNKRMLKLAAGATALPWTGLGKPVGVAVDSSGTLYVTDVGNDRVLKLAPGVSTPTVLPFTGLYIPQCLAVDSNGALYVADFGNHRVLKLAAGSSTQEVLPFTGIKGPTGVAVDSTGTLYVTDYSDHRVLKLVAGSSTANLVPFTGLKNPQGVSVDSSGALYVADFGNHRVLKLAPGSSTQEVLPFTGLNTPWGVAVDSAGNLYVTDMGNNRVLKLPVG